MDITRHELVNNPHESSWEAFSAWWGAHAMPDEQVNSRDLFTSHPLFTQAMHMNRSVTGVIDTRQMKFLYWSGDIKTLTGWDDENYIRGGVQFGFSKFHPSDLPGVMAFSEMITTHYRGLSETERAAYKGFWDFRTLRADGKYMRMLQQDTVLQHDPFGTVNLLLVFIMDITHLKNDRSIHLRIAGSSYDQLHEYSIAGKCIYRLSSPSERELAVFRLIGQGWTRKAIADQLGISLATVKTHCQHVFEKLRTNDSIETINLLKIFGLL